MQTELPASLAKCISILHKCKQKKNLNEAKRLHSYLQERDLETHPILANHLVPVLVECGSLQDTHHVFDKLPCHNDFSWASLISGYLRRGEPQSAFGLYLKMQDEGCVPPNRCTYLALLNACTRLRDTETGQQIHAEILLRGLECDISGGNALTLGNTLVDMYGKCGLHVQARQVFDKLPVQDSVSWNALIARYAEHRLGKEADDSFHQMQLQGIYSNTLTFVCILKACGTSGIFGLRQDLRAELTRRGLETELHVGSTLVDMYTEFGLLSEARQVFDGLSDRNVVSLGMH